MEEAFQRTWMRCRFLQEASLGSAESQNYQGHLEVLNVPQNPWFWSESSLLICTTCTCVKIYPILWPCCFCWTRSIGFLINIYSVTTIFLLPGLPVFSFQACFLITLLAPMSRMLLWAEANAIITARYFQDMFIITVSHGSRFMRTNWFQSAN